MNVFGPYSGHYFGTNRNVLFVWNFPLIIYAQYSPTRFRMRQFEFANSKACLAVSCSRVQPRDKWILLLVDPILNCYVELSNCGSPVAGKIALFPDDWTPGGWSDLRLRASKENEEGRRRTEGKRDVSMIRVRLWITRAWRRTETQTELARPGHVGIVAIKIITAFAACCSRC